MSVDLSIPNWGVSLGIRVMLAYRLHVQIFCIGDEMGRSNKPTSVVPPPPRKSGVCAEAREAVQHA